MPSEQVAALLKKVPGPDNQSLKSPQQVEEFNAVVDKLLSGGKESVAALVEFLKPREETNEENGKARFLIHAMAIKVGGAKDDKQRAALAGALAESLGGDRDPEVAAFIVRELQVCGDQHQAAAVGRLLTHENVELVDTAAQALVTFSAAEPLRDALPKTKGANRAIVIQNLGVLRDKSSADAIRKSLSDSDEQVRLASYFALAEIGDAGSADALLKAAKSESAYQKTQAIDACLRLAENLEEAGDKKTAAKIRSQLK